MGRTPSGQSPILLAVDRTCLDSLLQLKKPFSNTKKRATKLQSHSGKVCKISE